jgi:hypothetical protein
MITQPVAGIELTSQITDVEDPRERQGGPVLIACRPTHYRSRREQPSQSLRQPMDALDDYI